MGREDAFKHAFVVLREVVRLWGAGEHGIEALAGHVAVPDGVLGRIRLLDEVEHAAEHAAILHGDEAVARDRGAGFDQGSGYRTGYFWQEVLERERFLDILGSYMSVERREEKAEDAKGARTEKRETVIFPRYHQLQDAIYQIEHAQSVVKAIDQDSRQLARALVDGAMIVITTLQKFPSS